MITLGSERVKSKSSCQLVSEYETNSLPKGLNYNVENTTNSPCFPPFKLVLVAGSEMEMKNFTNNRASRNPAQTWHLWPLWLLRAASTQLIIFTRLDPYMTYFVKKRTNKLAVIVVVNGDLFAVLRRAITHPAIIVDLLVPVGREFFLRVGELVEKPHQLHVVSVPGEHRGTNEL